MISPNESLTQSVGYAKNVTRWIQMMIVCVTMDTVPTNNCVSVFMGPLHHDQSLRDVKEPKRYLLGQDTVHRSNRNKSIIP